jgi:hypothetical protein
VEVPARVKGHDIEGVDLFRFDEQGKISEITVLVRPLSGVVALVALGSRFVDHREPNAILLRLLAGPLGLIARVAERVITRLVLGRPSTSAGQ